MDFCHRKEVHWNQPDQAVKFMLADNKNDFYYAILLVDDIGRGVGFLDVIPPVLSSILEYE